MSIFCTACVCVCVCVCVTVQVFALLIGSHEIIVEGKYRRRRRFVVVASISNHAIQSSHRIGHVPHALGSRVCRIQYTQCPFQHYCAPAVEGGGILE